MSLLKETHLVSSTSILSVWSKPWSVLHSWQHSHFPLGIPMNLSRRVLWHWQVLGMRDHGEYEWQETHCWRKTAVHQVQPQHFKAIAVLLDRVHEVQERSLTLPDRAPSRTSNPSETQWYTAGLSWCVNCWVSKDDTHFPLLSHTFR